MSRRTKFYAVQKGRRPGVYHTWDACSAEVNGRSGSVYKSFPTLAEAEAFVSGTELGDTKEIPTVGGFGKATRERAGKTVRFHPYTPPPRTETPSYPIVWTDGSCLGNGRVGAKAGVGVYFGPADVRNVSEPLEGSLQTNQRAELTAAIRAIQIIERDGGTAVEIKTDSKYMCDAMGSWIHNWRKRDFANVKNTDLFRTLDSLCNRVRVKFVRPVSL